MIVPHQQISKDALHGLVESYIHREGTDYGAVEASLDDKVQQVMNQLDAGDVVVVFDEASESVSLMTLRQFNEAESQPPQIMENNTAVYNAKSPRQGLQDAFDEYSQVAPDYDNDSQDI